MALRQPVGGFFDVEVRCLRFLRIDNVNVMIPQHLAFSSCHTVGIEDHNDVFSAVAGVIREDVQQPVPCRLDVRGRQLLELLPGKNNVVSVHQQEFLHGLPLRRPLSAICRSAPPRGCPGALLRRSRGVPAVFLPAVRYRPALGLLRRQHEALSGGPGARPLVVRMTERLPHRPVGLLEDPPQLILLRLPFPLPLPVVLGLPSAHAPVIVSCFGVSCFGVAQGPLSLSRRILFPLRKIDVVILSRGSGRIGVIVLRAKRSLSGRLLLPSAVHVHEIPHPVPRHNRPGPVGAEHRPGRILRIRIRVVSFFLHDLSRIMAGLVSRKGGRKPSSPPGIARHHGRVISQLGGGHRSLQNRALLPEHRRAAAPVHLTDVGHGSPHVFCRQLQYDLHHRLQEDVLRHHQPLPHGGKRRLSEVSAGGVLFVRPSAQEADLHIGQAGACEHALQVSRGKLGKDQILPVPLQHVRKAAVRKRDPALRLPRLQQKMHLRIMPQRLEMTDSLHRPADGLPVYNGARSEFGPQIVPLPQKIL